MFNITLLPKIYQPERFETHKLSFTQVYDIVTQERPLLPKKQQVCWSPCIFKKGTKKGNENAIELSLMVLDIDDYYRFDEVHDILVFLKLSFFIHTSYSHDEKVKDKFRVVFPMRDPVPAELWRFYFDGMMDWFREHVTIPIVSKYGTLQGKDLKWLKLDTSVNDPGRAYYTMTHKPLSRRVLYESGEIVDWEMYADRARYAYEAKLDEKRRLAEEERERREAHLKNLEGRRVSHSDRRKYYYHMLSTQMSWRQRLADRLGCEIRMSSGGDRAQGFSCPSCQRTDCSYFYIDPIRNSHLARCGHLKSCGWSASVGYLAEINNFI